MSDTTHQEEPDDGFAEQVQLDQQEQALIMKLLVREFEGTISRFADTFELHVDTVKTALAATLMKQTASVFAFHNDLELSGENFPWLKELPRNTIARLDREVRIRMGIDD